LKAEAHGGDFDCCAGMAGFFASVKSMCCGARAPSAQPSAPDAAAMTSMPPHAEEQLALGACGVLSRGAWHVSRRP
jgi:hypothetical protein